MSYSILALSHYDKANHVFEDYCNGIKNFADDYSYIDYIELYLLKGKKKFEKDIIDLVRAKQIEYIFIITRSGDLTFDLCFLEELTGFAKIIFNFFDTEHYFDAVDKYYAQVASLVILPNYFPKFRFELLGINTLCTFALYDKDRYKFYLTAQKQIDVSFVGNVVKSNRSNYINYLVENGINVEQFGRGTANGLISFDKMLDIFNTSKINLNFSASADNSILILGESINNRIMQIKGRINEIALCGGFVLTEYAPGIEQMYKIGHEIDVFNSKEELLSKIKYYQNNPEKCELIAHNAYKRALEQYDASAGIKKIFQNSIPFKSDVHSVYYTDTFIANYSSYRFYYLVRFLINFNTLRCLEELLVIVRGGRINFLHAYEYTKRAISAELSKYIKVKNMIKKLLCLKEKAY